jgi:hypothetical protein
MKRKLLVSIIIMALLLMAMGPSSVLAAFAYQVQFTTYITYQNIGSATTTTLDIYLYDSPDDTTPLIVSQPNLAVDASTSVSVGSLGAPDGFQGSAVLSADQPLAATAVQLPPGVAIEPLSRNRPMSNGFTAGSQNMMIASVLKNAGAKHQYTKFGVQNAGDTAVNITIQFFSTTSSPVHTITDSLQPGAGLQVDTGTITQLGSAFSGSAVVTTTGGSIVSSAMELDNTDYGSKAFEGVGQGATTIYMPSALCNFNTGAGGIQNTNYAIQNTDPTNNANITVTWSNGNSVTKSNIPPFNKAVFNGCEGGNNSGFLGAATVTSNRPVIGLGKVAGGGLSTAFVGFATGSTKIALPYIRWAGNTRWFAGTMQRANIAIQNVGAPFAGNITVKYINPNGTQAGSTHTISGGLATGAKANSNPTNAGLTEFGCQNSCSTFGGGAIIEGPPGSQLVAIARLTSFVPTSGQRVGEDTNGVPHP